MIKTGRCNLWSLFLFFAGLIFLISCDERDSYVTATEIEISSDTLLFDTVFTSKGSITKRLKIYNRTNEDIIIPKIGIHGEEKTFYELVISGNRSNTDFDIPLRSGDSLLVLSSVTIDPSEETLPFIVHDSIEIKLASGSNYVHLVSWGQNANFLSDSILVCDQIWTSEKPYVLYNSVLIKEGCSLTVQPGTRVYNHAGSAIFVQGTLHSLGTVENPIIFLNDRLDLPYKESPGQWEGIYFLEGSTGNIMQNSVISNAKTGIRLGTPDNDSLWDLEMINCLITLSSDYGILSFTSDLRIENSIITQFYGQAITLLAGGSYQIDNCTFSNGVIPLPRREPLAIFSDNVILSDNSVLSANLDLQITNSVFWGNIKEEITVSNSGNTSFDLQIKNSLLKSSLSLFSGNSNILNLDPKFDPEGILPVIPLPESPLIDNGFDNGLLFDFFGNIRSTQIDIGALEFVN